MEKFGAFAAGHKIEKFKHLMKRVEKEQVTALIKSPEEKAAAVGDGLIDIADFSRMDLRVAVVKRRRRWMAPINCCI